MTTKRKIYKLRGGTVLDVDEFHDGRYGGPGGTKKEKKEVTPEQMKEANHRTKVKNCQRRLIQYFRPGDCFATLTYAVQEHETRKEGFSESVEKSEERILQERGGAVLDPKSGERDKRSLAYPRCYQRDRGCSGDSAACLG